MAERLLVVPSNLEPTLPVPCSDKRIRSLKAFFQGGQKTVETLDPVILIQDPHRTTGEESLLIFDGNHRLTLGFYYGLLVPAVLYTLQEEISLPPFDPFPVTEALITTRLCHRTARKRGYTSFKALANRSHLARILSSQ